MGGRIRFPLGALCQNSHRIPSSCQAYRLKQQHNESGDILSSHLSTLVTDKTAFYNALSRQNITEQEVISSQKFFLIKERFDFFEQLISIMDAGEGRIILDYDQTKVKDSEIKAKFMLYKRSGTPFKEEFCCFSLFIGYDDITKEYYPATYIVEHSNKYTNDQTPHYCTIEIILPPKKKKKKPAKKAK